MGNPIQNAASRTLVGYAYKIEKVPPRVRDLGPLVVMAEANKSRFLGSLKVLMDAVTL